MEENLLNTSIFEYLINEISEICKINRIETVTNGTILNDNVRNIIQRYNPFITVSLDSTEKINDNLRGEGTFKKILEFINYLKSISYKNFEVACTYTHIHELEGVSKKN